MRRGWNGAGEQTGSQGRKKWTEPNDPVGGLGRHAMGDHLEVPIAALRRLGLKNIAR